MHKLLNILIKYSLLTNWLKKYIYNNLRLKMGILLQCMYRYSYILIKFIPMWDIIYKYSFK